MRLANFYFTDHLSTNEAMHVVEQYCAHFESIEHQGKRFIVNMINDSGNGDLNNGVMDFSVEIELE